MFLVFYGASLLSCIQQYATCKPVMLLQPIRVMLFSGLK